MKRIRLLLLLGGLFASRPAIFAAEFFISPYGDDTATGASEAAPFATLDFADFLPRQPLPASDGRPIGLDPEEMRRTRH